MDFGEQGFGDESTEQHGVTKIRALCYMYDMGE